jgi:hypothetical protein
MFCKPARFAAVVACLWIATLLLAECASAAILIESGTLGPTGVSWEQVQSQTVPGTNVNASVFVGVRFELTQPVVTSQVGGHFLGPNGGELFAAIVALNDHTDFPNSDNLSSPDVLGTTRIGFPNPSSEVFGNLQVPLNPGWYALVFGSGLFEAQGFGGTVRNGLDIGDPTYIAHQPGGWFNLSDLSDVIRFENHRFVVLGRIIPEPTAIAMMLTLLPLIIGRPRNRR